MRPTGCGHAHDVHDWILGTLPPEEAQAFAEHLPICATCSTEVARLSQPAEGLADAVPQLEPPPELRSRVLAAINAEAELFRAASAPDAPPPGKAEARRTRPRVLSGLVGACLVAIGAVFGATVVGDDGGRLERTRTVAGSVTAAGGGSSARASVVAGERGARLVLRRLAPPPKGQAYQAWLIEPPARPAPTGGLFTVDPAGDAEVRLPLLRDVQTVIVTAERAGGSRSPTLPAVAAVGLDG